jgi:hypothetical protein
VKLREMTEPRGSLLIVTGAGPRFKLLLIRSAWEIASEVGSAILSSSEM